MKFAANAQAKTLQRIGIAQAFGSLTAILPYGPQLQNGLAKTQPARVRRWKCGRECFCCDCRCGVGYDFHTVSFSRCLFLWSYLLIDRLTNRRVRHDYLSISVRRAGHRGPSVVERSS